MIVLWIVLGVVILVLLVAVVRSRSSTDVIGAPGSMTGPVSGDPVGGSVGGSGFEFGSPANADTPPPSPFADPPERSSAQPLPDAAPPAPSSASPHRSPGAPAGAAPTIATLRVGDHVSHRSGDGVVVGTIMFEEDGSRWWSHRIEDRGGGRWWLGVDPESPKMVTRWTPVEPPATVGDTVEISGRRFELDESGRASYRADGDTDLPPSGSCEYRDYAARTNELLGLERFNGQEWEASVGESIEVASLRLTRP